MCDKDKKILQLEMQIILRDIKVIRANEKIQAAQLCLIMKEEQ